MLRNLCEHSLLNEYEKYKEIKTSLSLFLIEAFRAGCRKVWHDREYTVIVVVADMIPNDVVEEHHKLLMWYDQAVIRMGGE